MDTYSCGNGHIHTIEQIELIGKNTGCDVVNDIAIYECYCKALIHVPLAYIDVSDN